MNFIPLHGPTVSVLTAVVVTLMTSVALAVWRFNRGLPGLAQWALASLGGFAVLLVYLVRSQLPELVAVLITNFLMLGVACLTWLGSLAYLGKPLHRRKPAVLAIGVMLMVVVYFTQVQPDLRVRILVQSWGMAGFYLLATRTIVTGGLTRYPARYMFGLALAGHAVFLATARVRLLVSGNADLDAGKVILPALVGLESMVFFILLTLGVVLLVIEHISNKLIVLAETDGLTNVLNRRAFMAMLEKACSYANRNGTPLTVVVIDLDHFKRINDTWGHKAGDDVLRSFVAVTSSVVRNEDVIGRLGGEEFCVYLPETSLADAGDVADRIRRACAGNAVATGGQVIHYTASIGVARYEANEMPDAVIHRADQIMYRAKNLGRNRVERQEDARVPT